MSKNSDSRELKLAEQLDILFDVFRAPNGKPYTVKEVSEAIRMTPATVSRIRSGNVPDPRMSTLKMFARFFHISLDYFFCGTREECRDFLARERGLESIPELTLRSQDMARAIIADIERMVDYIDIIEKSERLHQLLGDSR